MSIKHAYLYELKLPFLVISLQGNVTCTCAYVEINNGKRQKINTTKIHKYVNSVCTSAPDRFVSVGLRLWDNMKKVVEFSDLKLEEEQADDAETLKLIGRLSTLEEVRFDSVFQALCAIS